MELYGAALLFAVGLVLFVGAIPLGDIPNGWATIIAGIAQVLAVLWATQAGFQAQENADEIRRMDRALEVAAPLQADIQALGIQFLSDHIDVINALSALPADSHPDSHFQCPQVRQFDLQTYYSQLPNIGALGPDLAFNISMAYRTLTAHPYEDLITSIRDGMRLLELQRNALLQIDKTALMLVKVREHRNLDVDVLTASYQAPNLPRIPDHFHFLHTPSPADASPDA